MKIKKLLVLAPIAVLSLTSCGGNKEYAVADYGIKAKHAKFDNTGLKILHLSDIHLSTNCDRQVQYKFMQETIDMANEYAGSKDGHAKKIDMIAISGDTFIFATKDIVREFCEFMEKQEIDWTITFGNHDEQCYFSIDWLTTYLNNLSKNEKSYLLFKDLQDDNVFGNANFYIDVPTTVQGDTIKERIYILDSNRYKYTFGSYGYDNIHEDQIKWYENCVKTHQGKFNSMAFFHIPFEEYKTYYESAIGNESIGEFMTDEVDTTQKLDRKGEVISCPKVESQMFEKMVELQNTKAVFVGHDHKNNFTLQTKDKENGNMILSYSVKATDSVGASEDLMGGQVITLRGNGGLNEISVHPICHTYTK